MPGWRPACPLYPPCNPSSWVWICEKPHVNPGLGDLADSSNLSEHEGFGRAFPLAALVAHNGLLINAQFLGQLGLR
jgi:hypothetical protein